MSQRDPDSNLSVYFLVGLLIIILVSAIPVIAAERTVFDSEHAIDTMAEEDVSAKTTTAFQEKLAGTIREALASDQSVDQDANPLLTEDQIQDIATSAMTESYVDAELTGHFERTYEYIDGDRDTLALVFDLSEPKQQAIAEAEALEREARAERGPGVTNPEAVPDGDLVIGSYLAEEFPDEQNITSGGAPPGEIETAAAASGPLTVLVWGLPILALLVVGLLYYSTRSPHRTGEAAGAALIAAGLLGLLGSFGGGPVARSLTEGRLTLENPEFASLSDGVVAIVGDLFETMTLLSGIIIVLGVVILGLVYADEHGYFDSLHGDDARSEGRESVSREAHEETREVADRSSGSRERSYETGEATRAEREYDTGDGQPVTGTDQSGADTDQSIAGADRSTDDRQESIADTDQSDTDSGESVFRTDESTTRTEGASGSEDSSTSITDGSAAGATGDQTDESQEYDPDVYDEHGFKRESAERTDSKNDGNN